MSEVKDTCKPDNFHWSEVMRILFAETHFDAAPIEPIDCNYTHDKHGLLIGGAGG